MPKANKGGKAHKGKVYAVPTAQKKKGLELPKFQALAGKQKAKIGEGSTARPTPASLATLSAADQYGPDSTGAGMGGIQFYEPIDASLTTRDSSSKAFMRELRKVIERSDVIIQVLDARDPDGTRSRWVEDEVRKRDVQGKKLLAVLNKIDLVPRANLEAWLKHLRHSFPTMPFKSSTQSQRQHLSQNAVPLAQPSAVPGQQVNLPALPTTSSSLGAPALLHLLKQYALSTPHSALTVGVVGYPNVGKSSLINSLKRSRACAVAAMPGKTRIVQEVVLDKGVKILDCPGVVLEDIGREMEGEAGKRKQAEIMLRNCVKAELVEDPISPVEVILSKVDPAQLQKLYNIPPYDNIRDFLIKVALTRGRLGKGGIPDLEGSAVSVLRDWNSGKISYFTVPPAVHPSSAPSAAKPGTGPSAPAAANGGMEDDVEMGGEKVGDAKILNTLSEAFTLDGLFDNLGDEAAWDGEEVVDQQAMVEESELVAPVSAPAQTIPAAASHALKRPFDFDSEDASDSDDDSFRPPVPISGPSTVNPATNHTHPAVLPRQPAFQPNKLFTSEELAMMPEGVLDRQKAKQAAKKAKKKRAAAERTEGELMLGFMGMDVEEPQAQVEEIDTPSAEREGFGYPVREVLSKKSKKEKRKEKKVQQNAQRRAERAVMDQDDDDMGMDDDQRQEADFANFLSNMGANGSDEEL
ncbi:nuclear GTP-binding protein [Kwoniella heveanensis BCC8398]|uniref:Nuclear GTP-binding protein n=1 Tax=Kwoniella heveanensis BCC8398 TaxID=1296120 RepID=A0A1B9GME5_9TREE|nr:nuclear GTP-binding protein [Kwoniella heveanensis BCC8398]